MKVLQTCFFSNSIKISNLINHQSPAHPPGSVRFAIGIPAAENHQHPIRCYPLRIVILRHPILEYGLWVLRRFGLDLNLVRRKKQRKQKKKYWPQDFWLVELIASTIWKQSLSDRFLLDFLFLDLAGIPFSVKQNPFQNGAEIYRWKSVFQGNRDFVSRRLCLFSTRFHHSRNLIFEPDLDFLFFVFFADASCSVSSRGTTGSACVMPAVFLSDWNQ